MLRHLHDLSALKAHLEREQGLFITTTLESFATDQQQQSRQIGCGLREAAQRAFIAMRDDRLYADEYQQFVDAMSYAPDAERIDFDTALRNFVEISRLFD